MRFELNPTQAFWLGHLYYASALNMPLSDYAASQTLTLTDLLMWVKWLSVQGLPVPVSPPWLGRCSWSCFP